MTEFSVLNMTYFSTYPLITPKAQGTRKKGQKESKSRMMGRSASKCKLLDSTSLPHSETYTSHTRPAHGHMSSPTKIWELIVEVLCGPILYSDVIGS